MNDHQLDALVASAANVSDDEIARWVHDVPFDQLCEDIMTTTDLETTSPSTDEADNVRPLRPARPARRWKRVAVLASAAAAIAVLLLAVSVRDDGHRSKAWAAPLVQFAQRSPLLLLNDSAWQVTRADENGVGEGEMTFTRDGRHADLHWRNGSLAQWLDDRKHEGIDHGSHDVVNGTADVIQYDGSATYLALWESDDAVLEFRMDGTTAAEFGDLLDLFVVVDTDAWLQAMPPSVIAAAEQPAAIDEMLIDIPLPPGFDVAILGSQADVKDRYQLGVRVVSAVSCAWIEQWIDATAAGDDATATAAADAMATSRAWPILQEMAGSGAYPEVLQTFVDVMSQGDPAVVVGKAPLMESYRSTLGCDA